VVSYEQTPPPRPIQWAVDSPKTHTKLSHQPGFGPIHLTVDASPHSSPPVDTAMDNDNSAKRHLDSFINEVTRKWDPPLICEPPK
jgi:hypothetical protein